jgi:hypothetical protein
MSGPTGRGGRRCGGWGRRWSASESGCKGRHRHDRRILRHRLVGSHRSARARHRRRASVLDRVAAAFRCSCVTVRAFIGPSMCSAQMAASRTGTCVPAPSPLGRTARSRDTPNRCRTVRARRGRFEVSGIPSNRARRAGRQDGSDQRSVSGLRGPLSRYRVKRIEPESNINSRNSSPSWKKKLVTLFSWRRNGSPSEPGGHAAAVTARKVRVTRLPLTV